MCLLVMPMPPSSVLMVGEEAQVLEVGLGGVEGEYKMRVCLYRSYVIRLYHFSYHFLTRQYRRPC